VVGEYWLDAWQRSVLFLDTLRQRGNIYNEHNAKEISHVLHFESELVLDGPTLERPVNYGLVRIVPRSGTQVDPSKTPIIVIDPRAGHGPGIGGMKPDSQIGVGLAADHPCYFVGFSPKPMPGQTIEKSFVPKRSSLRRSRNVIRTQKADPLSSPTARRDGRS
jgi:Protein of unknown function (DUF3141)